MLPDWTWIRYIFLVCYCLKLTTGRDVHLLAFFNSVKTLQSGILFFISHNVASTSFKLRGAFAIAELFNQQQGGGPPLLSDSTLSWQLSVAGLNIYQSKHKTFKCWSAVKLKRLRFSFLSRLLTDNIWLEVHLIKWRSLCCLLWYLDF